MLWPKMMMVAAAVMGGAQACADDPTGEQSAPADKAKVAAAMKQPVGSVRLQVSGLLAQAIARARMVVLDSAPVFSGTLELRPKACEPDNPGVADVALDFNLTDPAGTTCVFQVLMTKGSKGQIVPAVDVPYCPDGEPVFELKEGSAVFTGTRPVGKGKRSRAGAPGTWFAIEIEGDKEYHYLLSDDAADEYVVSTTKNDGSSDWKMLTHASRAQYIMVDSAGNIDQKNLSDEPDRQAAWNDLRAIADKCPAPPKTIDARIVALLRDLYKKEGKFLQPVK